MAPHTTLMLNSQLTPWGSDSNEFMILFSRVLRMWNKAANGEENPQILLRQSKRYLCGPRKHTFSGSRPGNTQEIQWLEGSGGGRLTVAVNYGKQQFQVVLCLLHQVPTLLGKKDNRGLETDT